MGRFLPPDHAKGDERTLGGYAAVHGRPAAFEGVDGRSYSAEILAEQTGDAARPWGAYVLFVQWGYGDPRIAGHVESDVIAFGASEEEALARAGAMPLEEAKALLDSLVRGRWASAAGRPFWEVMRDEGDPEEER